MRYWFGCTFADLVFPWFVFIMGVAMPLAFARRHQRGDRTSQVFGRIAQRVLLLIGLGLALTAVASWPAVVSLRFPGVLQRIALSYLVAAFIVWNLGIRGWITAIAVLLLGHWALLALVPFGGFPGGTLTPEHNLARYLDTLVFGRHALTIPNDPEGLLGTLPAAATALIGAVAGELMRRAANDRARFRALIIFGAAAFVAGLAWSFALPLSKPLWTGSYVLVVTGLGMLALALIYLVVDVCGLRAWARPLLWLGVEPACDLRQLGSHRPPSRTVVAGRQARDATRRRHGSSGGTSSPHSTGGRRCGRRSPSAWRTSPCG